MLVGGKNKAIPHTHKSHAAAIKAGFKTTVPLPAMWCIYSCTFCKSVFIVSDDFVSPSLRGSNHISLCCRPNCLQLGSVRMPKCFLQINCIAFPINTVTTAPPPKVKGCRISIGNAHLDVNRKTSSDLMNNLKGTDSVAIATGPSVCTTLLTFH